jgi:putative transcriptional regulator
MNRVSELRKRKNITQVKLAEQCNCSRSHLANIEKGNANASLQTAKNIALALDSTIDFVFNASNSQTLGMASNED